MLIRPCELDSRIRSLYDIQTCLEYDDKFINEEGYFAHTLSDFSNLEDCDFGKLVSVDADNIRYIFNRDNLNRFELFIPEKLLKPVEKKYRPFSICEFEEMLALQQKDDFVCFRFKFPMDNVSNLFHKLRYLGYVLTEDENYEESGDGCLYFGNNISGSPKYLFEHLELLSDGKWVPFGVEVSKDD